MKKESRHVWLLPLLGMTVIGAVLMAGCIGGPGEGPGGGTGGGLTGDWCAVGAYATTPQGSARVTGIEKHTINGISVDLCCGEIEISGEGGTRKSKSCHSKDGDCGLVFNYNEETGAWIKFMEVYPEGGKTCRKTFDEAGTVTMESCS
ncbi:MAG: hypothetical protein WA977_06100 [Halobacteriota archaeon]